VKGRIFFRIPLLILCDWIRKIDGFGMWVVSAGMAALLLPEAVTDSGG
jgi:hypothetical protein